MRFLELFERLVEDFGDVEKTDDVPVLVADGLEGKRVAASDFDSGSEEGREEGTNEMAETSSHHRLEGFGRGS